MKIEEWIPVTERQPEKNGWYLVTKHTYGNIGFEMDEIQIGLMRYLDGRWVLPVHIPSWINNELTTDILAWRELPEPYRKGDE